MTYMQNYNILLDYITIFVGFIISSYHNKL